jgi:hypothetical protein
VIPAAFVDGRGSRLAGGRRPLAGAGAPAASGSRSWCHRHGPTARRWRPPDRWWPGRRRAAPRTAPAALQSAGPGLGRAKSPPEQAIEHVFGIPSAMLPTATGRIVGHIGGTDHRSAQVNSGQSRQARILVDGRLRRCAAGPEPACFALLRQRFDPGQVALLRSRSSQPHNPSPHPQGRPRQRTPVSVMSRAAQHNGAKRR